MLDFQAIQERLPHRAPFLFIDKALEVVPGERAVAVRAVSGNEAFFQGHFPGHAVMPGVLLVEAMAQTGALALLEPGAGQIAFLAGVDKARFHKQVVPGDLLTFTVTLTQRRGPIGKGQALCENDRGEKVASCELLFAIQEN